MMATEQPVIGFIGLGAMGGAMARNLLEAGYTVIGFDLDAEKIPASGVTSGAHVADVVQRSDVIMTSLTNSAAFVQVAENDLLPHLRHSQTVIALGTVMPDEVRRLAQDFAAKGVALLDVPVSGGARGAAAGTLRMFGGGDQAAFDRVRPLLTVLGTPEYIVYCGPSGSGEVVKFVNQLAMGLSAAAHLEAIALGVQVGLDADVLAAAVGGDASWRARFAEVARQVAGGSGHEVGVKFGQLMYFITEAQNQGLDLPLARALYAFCEHGERMVMEANRLSPSFWHELTKGGDTKNQQ